MVETTDFLGAGGQSQVYRGTLLDGFMAIGQRCFNMVIQAGMAVAVKTPRPEAPRDTPTRLKWEAQICARVRDAGLPNPPLLTSPWYPPLLTSPW